MKLSDANILVVDTETTGMDPDNHKICEVGWATVAYEFSPDGRGLYPFAQASEKINPQRPIPAVASAVHHITNKHVEDCPTAEQWAQSNTIMQRADLIIAHNAEFDRAFCVNERLAHPSTPWLCTWRLARHLFPDAPSHKNQVLRYWLGFEDVEGDAHRAGHDALVTAHIACHMLNHVIDPALLESVPSLLAYAESPALLMGKAGFGKHRDKTWQKIAKIDRPYLQWMAKQGPNVWDKDTYFTITELLNGRGTTRSVA